MPPARNRGKAGRLGDLPSMPLDIVYETLYLLYPFDLLRLSRTTKAFRKLLTDRNSAHIWKSARENVPGLPPCPSYLSEIAYARLAFEKVCHSCLGAGTSTVFFEFLARYCPQCRDKMLIVWRVKDDHPLLETINQFNLRIDDDILAASTPIHIVLGKRPKLLLRLKALEDFKSEVQKLSTAQRRMAYIIAQHKMTKDIHDDAELFYQYLDDNKAIREEELASLKDERRTAIIIRLPQEWRDEMGKFDDDTIARFITLPEVNKTQKLTDKVWSVIEPAILKFLVEQQDARLVHEALVGLSPILNNLDRDLTGILDAIPDQELLPRRVDIYTIPEVKVILLKLCLYHKHAPTFPVSLFPVYRDMLAKLPDIVTRWQVDTRRVFHETVIPDANTRTRILRAARTCFKCSRCEQVLFYPGVISHECLYKLLVDEPSWGVTTIDRALVYPGRPDSWARVKPWSMNNITIDETLCRQMDGIIRACGKKPKSITSEEMNKLDVRLVCMNCNIPGEYQEVMSWRRAIIHCYPNVYNSTDGCSKPMRTWHMHDGVRVENRHLKWAIYDGESIAHHEEKASSTVKDRCWCCSVCQDGLGYTYTISEINQHLDMHDDLSDAKAKCRPDSFPVIPPSIVLKPKDKNGGKAGRKYRTVFTDLKNTEGGSR